MTDLVTVVGVGALGSHVIPLLRGCGVRLRAIDFDRVETKNTKSQFFAKNTVGKNKALSLAQLMQFLWGMKLETFSVRLGSKNAVELLKGSRLVLDCLDNAQSREIVQDTVRDLGIPCLHGALAPDGLMGRVIWDEHFIIDSEDTAGAATCEDGDHLPFIALTSSYLARSAQEFLESGKRLAFDVYPKSPSTRI